MLGSEPYPHAGLSGLFQEGLDDDRFVSQGGGLVDEYDHGFSSGRSSHAYLHDGGEVLEDERAYSLDDGFVGRGGGHVSDRARGADLGGVEDGSSGVVAGCAEVGGQRVRDVLELGLQTGEVLVRDRMSDGLGEVVGRGGVGTGDLLDG